MAKFKLTQDWVGYLQRSYEQIKASVLKKLTLTTPEITDHTDGNLMIVILSMFAGVAEMLNLYIDRMAEEAFLGTARRYSSVVKIVSIIDYRIKTRRTAYVTVTFTYIDTTTGLPTNVVGKAITIPAGTRVYTSNNLPFITVSTVDMVGGTSSVSVDAKQSAPVVNFNLGNTNGQPNQKLPMPVDYTHATGSVTINGIPFTLVTTFGVALPTDNIFIVDVDEAKQAYAMFGDGVTGAIPPTGFPVLLTYEATTGPAGNVPPNNIIVIDGTQLTAILTPTVPSRNLLVTNPDYAFGGMDIESIDEIRNNAPRSIRTLERMVTYQDYIDVAIMHPLVGDAAVRYCCGQCVKVYVTPVTKGVFNQSASNQIQIDLNKRAMMHRCMDVIPSGITRVYIRATISAAYLIPPSQTALDVGIALDKEYGYLNSYINRTIRMSDITALIDNVPSVQSLTPFDEFWAEPYARPEGHWTPLSWSPKVFPQSTVRATWTVIYRKAFNRFELYRDNAFIGTTGTNVIYTAPDGSWNAIFNNGVYQDNYIWNFVVYPFGKDIVFDDFTVPIIDVEFQNNTAIGFYQLPVVPTLMLVNNTPPC